jgi:hypothetical protein
VFWAPLGVFEFDLPKPLAQDDVRVQEVANSLVLGDGVSGLGLAIQDAVNLDLAHLEEFDGLRAVQRGDDDCLPQLVLVLARVSCARVLASVARRVALARVVVAAVGGKLVDIVSLGGALGVALIGKSVGLSLESADTLAFDSQYKDAQAGADGYLVEVEDLFAVIDIFASAKDGNLFLAIKQGAESPAENPLVVAQVEANRNILFLEGYASARSIVGKLLAVGWGRYSAGSSSG